MTTLDRLFYDPAEIVARRAPWCVVTCDPAGEVRSIVHYDGDDHYPVGIERAKDDRDGAIASRVMCGSALLARSRGEPQSRRIPSPSWLAGWTWRVVEGPIVTVPVQEVLL
jgi:hypothetical protein